MAVKILHKRGSRPPQPDDLDVGEVALNTLEGKAYTKKDDGTVVEITGGESAGAGMVISPTEPADPVDGMQWLDSTTARVWVWDEDKWLEFPAAGGSVEGSGLIEVSEEPPEPPYEIGQQWFSSTDGYLYIWYGAEWVAIGGAGGGDGGDGGGSSEPGDTFWSSVGLLINCDGEANGSTNIVDATNKNQITVVNGAKVSTGEFKYGTGSIDLTSGYLELSDSSQAIQGANQFTFETWIYRTNTSSSFQYVYSTGFNCQIFLNQNKLNVYLSSNGSNYDVTLQSNETLPSGQWVHVVVQKSASNAISIYFDGQLSGQVTNGSAIGPPTKIRLGCYEDGQYLFDGYLDDVRITKGIGRYVDGFTVPDKHPTKEALKRAKVITVDVIDPVQSGDNDADLS